MVKMIKTSIYPTDIDERIFFQDMQIKDVPDFENYQKHINDSQYTKASDILEKSDLTTYSAWLLNWFNGKLINIEKEANSKEQQIEQNIEVAKQIAANLYLTYYQTTEPNVSAMNVNDTWIK